MKRMSRVAAGCVVVAALAGRAGAYIDLAPTLPKIISDSATITVVEVKGFDHGSRSVTLAPVEALKGSAGPEVKHTLAAAGEAVPLQLLRWATPGNRGVLFAAKTRGLVCIGTAWYAVRLSGGQWKPDVERPDLPLAYFGSLPRLVAGVSEILQGRSAVITTVAYGSDAEGAMFDIALNRQSLPGVVRVQRVRASKTMPAAVWTASSDPGYFVGAGVADKRDVPALIAQLKEGDGGRRAEAAEDLGTLGRAGRPAIGALEAVLKDDDARARSGAAGALVRIDPGNAAALEAIEADLGSADARTRRMAVGAAGFAGERGAGLASRLAALLKDPDSGVRLTALQSLSMLGPAAAEALPALMPLLEDADLSMDAADAIGRIGAKAAEALPRLAKMLDSPQAAQQWAAVRAMSQIGGPGAHPAVTYILKAMDSANEVEGYNIMIYLALLGPEAKEALPRLPSFAIKNRGLTTATTWAIDPSKGYPWKPAGGFLGFGAPMAPRSTPGFGAGGGLGANVFENLLALIYASYIHNLGPRLGAVAPRLAQDILKDNAGDVPPWGYEILNADAARAIELLAPALSSERLSQRERAAVALGYMGPPAAASRGALAAARDGAKGEAEQRLMAWALRQVSPE
jgi:HEAT repeat protein